MPAIVAVYGGVYILNTVAWRLTMIEPPRLSFGRAWTVNVAAFAINYLTPFASIGGEPFKIVAASQWMGTRNGDRFGAQLPARAHAGARSRIPDRSSARVLPAPVGHDCNADPRGDGAVLLLLGALLLAVHREGVIERLFDIAARFHC